VGGDPANLDLLTQPNDVDDQLLSAEHVDTMAARMRTLGARNLRYSGRWTSTEQGTTVAESGQVMSAGHRPAGEQREPAGLVGVHHTV
jgi:hypothetical protein